MKNYIVTFPIAGHVHYEIEAESEDAAIEAGWQLHPDKDGEVEYEVLDSFGRGNITHCPSPYEISVQEA